MIRYLSGLCVAGLVRLRAAGVLDELRALRGPLLTGQLLTGQRLTEQWPAEVPPAAQWQPQHWRALQERTPPPRAVRLQRAQPPGPEPRPQPRLPAGCPVADDELRRTADGEEAWW